VDCLPGSVSYGSAVCTRNGFSGQPFCFQPGYGSVKPSTHVGSNLQVGLGVPSSTPTQTVSQALGSAIAQALDIPADHLVKSQASQPNAAAGSSRRLQDSRWSLQYEFVVPTDRDHATLVEKAENMTLGSSEENDAFEAAVQKGSLAAPVTHMESTDAPHVFDGYVAVTPSGQIVNYESIASGSYETDAVTHSVAQTSPSGNPSSDTETEATPADPEEPQGPSPEMLQMSERMEEGMAAQLKAGLGSDGSELKDGDYITRKIPGLGTASAMYVEPSGNALSFDLTGGSPQSPAEAQAEEEEQRRPNRPKIEAITVPAETVAQFGKNAVLSLLVVPKDLFESGNSTKKKKLSVPVIGLDIRTESGLKLKKLPAPIVLTFSLGNQSGDQPQDCVYWDEDSSSWSSAGIVTGKTPEGKLRCETSHLSFFSAVAGEFGNVIACSNFGVLDPENLKKIPQGDWMYGPGAFILWVVFMAQWCLLIRSARIDYQNEKNNFWNERAFCADEHGQDITAKDHGWAAFLRNLLFGIGIDEFIDFESITKLAVRGVVTLATSFQLWALPVDVKMVIRYHGRHDVSYAPSIKRSRLVQEVHEQAGDVYTDFYDKTDVFGQVGMVTAAIHPISNCFMKSFTISSKLQGLMLTTQILSSLAISALFFNAAGAAPSVDSPPECKPPADFWASLLRDMIIGLISAFIGKLPMLLVRKFHKRKCHYQGTRWWHHKEDKHWSERAMETHIHFVRTVDMLCIIFCILLSLFAVFFVMAFLANVDSSAQMPFTIAFVVKFVQNSIVSPFLVSVVYVSIANILLWTRPQMHEACKKHFDLHYEEKLRAAQERELEFQEELRKSREAGKASTWDKSFVSTYQGLTQNFDTINKNDVPFTRQRSVQSQALSIPDEGNASHPASQAPESLQREATKLSFLQDCLDVLVDMREDTRGSSETAKDARQQSKVMPLDLEVERQRTAVFDQELQAVGAHEEPHLENGHQLVSVPNGAAAPLGTGQTANGAGPVGNGLVEHHVIVDASGDERDSFIALASQGSLTSLMSSSTHLYADIPASPVLHQRLPDLQPHADIPTPRAQLQPLRGLEPISFREADFHDRKTDALADLSGELQSDGQICRELVGDIDDPGRSQHHQAAAVLFEIEVDKSRGGAIGLDVDHHVDHSIKITQIKPGLISDWNFEHPDLKVAVGDYITEINGVSGNLHALVVAVSQSSKLKMTIQRGEMEKASVAPPDVRIQVAINGLLEYNM